MIVLDDCIELSTLTQKALSLRREILEIRERRETGQGQHDELKEHYEQRLDFGSNHVRHIIRHLSRYYCYSNNNSNRSLNSNNSNRSLDVDPEDEVKKEDSSLSLSQLPPYLIRKCDEVVRTLKTEELLSVYTRHMQTQNQECVEYMQSFITFERKEIGQRKAALSVVKQELIQIVAKNVASYCRRKKTNLNNTGEEAMMMSRSNSLQRLSRSMGYYNDNNNTTTKRQSMEATMSVHNEEEVEKEHTYSWKNAKKSLRRRQFRYTM